MRQFFSTVLFTILLTACSTLPTPTSRPAAPSAYLRVEASLARLEVDGQFNCTAFSLSPGRWLTSSHCIEYPNAVISVNGIPTTSVVGSKEKDLALLITEQGYLPGLKLAETLPAKGDRFYIVGYALAMEDPFPTTGFVVSPSIDARRFPLTMPRTPERFLVLSESGTVGQSGAPVINEAGEVIGVFMGAGNPDSYAQHVGVATPIDVVRKFLGYKSS